MRMDQEKVVIFFPTFSFDVDFSCKDTLEDYFKQLFLKLEARYDVEMKGFYQIKVYQDSYYGSIFDIEAEEVPYLDFLDHQVEMSIQVLKMSKFLYQIDDFLDVAELKDFCNCYYYQHHFYVEIINKMPDFMYWKLLEYSKLIYGKKVSNIIHFGNLLDFSLCK